MSNYSDEKRKATPMVAEDGPMMRSVALMPTQRMEPINPFQRLSLDREKPLHQSHAQPKPFVHVADNKKTSVDVESNSWKVTKARCMPSNYRMDRSHVRIPGTSPLEISKRIAEFFFRESIAATYDNEQVCISCTGRRVVCLVIQRHY
jgi:hypothetical protein